MSESTQKRIEELLKSEFLPTQLEVIDESALHHGHSGARQTGGGHFKVRIFSEALLKMSRVDAHRAIWEALKSVESEIHALSIQIK